MEIYRLFIAAELPADIMAVLSGTQDRLRRANPPVKWVAATAMHLTLKFLGETDVALLPGIGLAMTEVLADRRPAAVQLGEVGAFPNLRRPSVIWAGTGGNTRAVAEWQAGLDVALAALGIPRETKPFRPHLTLGRVRRDAPPDQVERLGAAIRALSPIEPVAWSLDRVVLFRSQLRGDGPIYTPLDVVTLSQ
jgi:2'-5' RNA ligase